MTLAAGGAVTLLTGLDPDRETARRWAVEELSRREYQESRPSRLAEAVQWLIDQVQAALERIPGSGSVSWSALVSVVVLAVVLLVVWLVTGPVRRTARRRGAGVDLFGGTRLTAAEHRRAAADAADAGRWAVAIQEMFRATARSLEERTVLDSRAGRTAGEVAIEAGLELPSTAASLLAAARAFDDVTYGERPGDRAGFELVTRADADVASARLRIGQPV